MPLETPQWVHDVQADELVSEDRHRLFMLALERHGYRHQEAVHRRGENHHDRLDWPTMADEAAYAVAVTARLSPAEWIALSEWHRHDARRRSQVRRILALIASYEACMTHIGESGIVSAEGDPALAEAVAAIVALAARFKGGQRRHFLRMLEEAGNSGLTTTITISVAGEPHADQEGISARSHDAASRPDRTG